MAKFLHYGGRKYALPADYDPLEDPDTDLLTTLKTGMRSAATTTRLPSAAARAARFRAVWVCPVPGGVATARRPTGSPRPGCRSG